MIFRVFVVDANGNRNYPYLNQDDRHWNLNWNCLENDLNSNGRIAVSGKQRQIVNLR